MCLHVVKIKHVKIQNMKKLNLKISGSTVYHRMTRRIITRVLNNDNFIFPGEEYKPEEHRP